MDAEMMNPRVLWNIILIPLL